MPRKRELGPLDQRRRVARCEACAIRKIKVNRNVVVPSCCSQALTTVNRNSALGVLLVTRVIAGAKLANDAARSPRGRSSSSMKRLMMLR